MIDTPLLNALGRFLSLSVSRHEVIAANMANVDTPGYKTRDIDFRRVLDQATGGDEGLPYQPAARKILGLIERPDGNNVSLERESLAMSQNQLLFDVGVQVLKTEFRRLASAIKEGA
ncbi:MAG TPA: flagellar basal body protein [Terriglobales bacterium]|nr:flagellar basal body protein [Terriglobales bacterium]